MGKCGMVYLVGAGPGDKQLITVRGLSLLKCCDVLIYDRLVSLDLVSEVGEQCEKIYVGKQSGYHTFKQEEINQLLVKKALENKCVVRLKGGDPYVFGRGGEEILAMQKAAIPYEVIPGITSAIAVPSYEGIPVTYRGMSQSFHVITGYTFKEQQRLAQMDVFAKLDGTLIFLMGMEHLEIITEQLMCYGKKPDTKVAVISNGTTPLQKSVRGTLEDIVQKVNEANLAPPAIIIIGEVAGLNLNDGIKEALHTTMIGVVATEKFTYKLEKLLQNQGGRVVSLTKNHIEIDKENKKLHQAFMEIGTYDWVVFTSAYGVEAFFSNIEMMKVDYRKLAHLKFAVVGNGTKEALWQKGYIADYMPQQFTSKALGEGLKTRVDQKTRLLLIVAENSKEEVVDTLRDSKCIVEKIEAYQMISKSDFVKQQLEVISKLDFVVFASREGVIHFLEDGKEKAIQLLEESKVIVLGELAAKALEQAGIRQLIKANPYTAEGVVNVILQTKNGGTL